MDLLVTLIGNAAVDPFFRKRFLDNPVDTADEYGFRLTKGEFEMMKTVFADLTQTEKNALQEAFVALENLLYKQARPRVSEAVRVVYFPAAGTTRAPRRTEDASRGLKPRRRASGCAKNNKGGCVLENYTFLAPGASAPQPNVCAGPRTPDFEG